MSFSRWLKRLGLETPAAIFLETYEPLRYFLAQGLQAVAPFWPGEAVARLAAALSPEPPSPSADERVERQQI